MRKIGVVLTTINIPRLLSDYIENANQYNFRGSIDIIVVADLKTPPAARQVINGLEDKGVNCFFFSVEEQENWMSKFSSLQQIVPYNTDNRRNLGYLLAAERGADIIISIDDDSYVGGDDFFIQHSIVGQNKELHGVVPNNGWFNPCDLLTFSPNRRIYARGFPYSKRWNDHPLKFQPASGRVVLNAGLWLEDPDIDAIARLNEPIKAISACNEIETPLAVPPGVYCPINSQNTAFLREILPCYYFILLDLECQGITMRRFCDIWTGYFAKKVIDAMGDLVTFGGPITIHRRNQHSYLEDLRNEFLGLILEERFVELLENISITSTNYSDAYLELAENIIIKLSSSKIKGFECAVKDGFLNIGWRMKEWVKTCNELFS